jgi:RecA/RadA recombinase
MTDKQRMGMDAAMDVLRKNAKKDKRSSGFETVKSETDNYRYIDFWDPKMNMPCLGLEWLWGARGLLCGRMLKLQAPEGTGKSSWLMLMYAMAQQTANAWCIHEESEGTVAPPDFVASFGADPDNILMPKLQTRSIEAAFADIDWTTAKIRGEIDPDKVSPIVVGMDSISGFGADTNMDENDYDSAVASGGLGVHARVVSKWFRDRGFILEDRDVLLMITAQTREKISTGGFSAPGEKKKTTLADNPLNFHASYRMEMYSTKLKDGATQIGETVHFTTTKNKLSPKGKTLAIDLYWDHGFDLQSATCDLLRKYSPFGLPDGSTFDIQQRGAYIKCPILGDKNVHSNPEGKLAIMQGICNDESLLKLVREAMRVRGFGYDFERRYQLSEAELEDNTEAQGAALEG